MANPTNTSYVQPTFLAPRAGIRAARLFHPSDKIERVGVLLGSKTRAVDTAGLSLTDKFVPSPGSTVVWTHPDSMPQLQRVGDGEVIYSASVISLGRQRFIVRPEAVADDGSCIVHIESGIFGELDLATLKDKELFPHGSFALDPGSTLVGMNESVGDVPDNAPSKGLAKRLKWRVTRDISDSVQIPWHRNDLWQVKPDGQILVQGVNGESFRLIALRGGALRKVEAPNGHATFEQLEGERLARNIARRKERIVPATSADVATLPAPETMAAVAEEPKGFFSFLKK